MNELSYKSRLKPTRTALLFWCLFIGIGAVVGAVCMFIKPDGSLLQMQNMLPYFKKLPLADILYQNYIFPGVALLIINGLTNLTAAVLLFRKKPLGIRLGMCFGVTLMLWICIQFYMFPFNFLSTVYFIFGMIQFFTGYAALVFEKQESFHFDPAEYPNVGTNPRLLVVYFSRMGYTKKLAYEAANKTGAAIYEIRATEHTSGTTGFRWCGRYGMHRWPMPIEPIHIALQGYDHVTICTPVWVFSLASPMREFCRQARSKLRQADYILCHHMKCRFQNVAKEMDVLLDIQHTDMKSVCCRKGRYL